MVDEDNLIWRESSDEHPVAVSYITGEGIVVRIEDRRIQFDTWTELKRRIKKIEDGDQPISYDGMGEDAKASIDFIREVIEEQDEYMSLIEGLEV